jgi:hypothetical protein
MHPLFSVMTLVCGYRCTSPLFAIINLLYKDNYYSLALQTGLVYLMSLLIFIEVVVSLISITN